MKAADRSGALYAVIIGETERDAGTAVIRPMRSDGEQISVRRAELVNRLGGA